MRRLFPLLVLLTVIAHADQVDDLAAAEMKASHAPGLVVAIVKKGEIVKIGAYGTANLETKTPVTAASVFRVASMSKQFCAAAAMLLVEDGKWKVEDPISKYIPNAPEAWKDITLRHLLTHTSGMPTLEAEDGFTFRTNPSSDDYIAKLAKKPLRFAPGDKYEYSNEGYSLLGILVAKVSGSTLASFVTNRIFKPAGMSTASYYLLERIVPDRANGYTWDKDHLENAIPLRPYAMAGSGGIMASILDFAKWDAALYTNSPLSQAIEDQIWSPAVLNSGTKIAYGFGWSTKKKDGKLIASHNGSTAGFGSRIVRHVDEGLTVIAFENVQNGTVGDFADKVADLYLSGKAGQ